jgi:hypothetical protein
MVTAPWLVCEVDLDPHVMQNAIILGVMLFVGFITILEGWLILVVSFKK